LLQRTVTSILFNFDMYVHHNSTVEYMFMTFVDFMKAHFPQEENVVRRALTAKCSDEAKCLKQKSKSHVVDTGEKPEVEHSLKELSGFNL
jgi:hypothetical protein